jgi:AF2212-like protein
MTRTVTATFDGEVLRPDEPIGLEPNTKVRITIEASEPPTEKTLSFLDTAASLNLEGPADWSQRFENIRQRLDESVEESQ